MRICGLFVAAFMLLAALISTSAFAAAKPQRIHLLEVSTSFVGTGGLDESFNGPPKVGQGAVIGSDFYKWNGTKRGAKVGTLQITCTFTKVTSNSAANVCTGAALLPGGQIAVSGVIQGQSRVFDVPIIGGTGRYAGARGYVHVKQFNENNSADTFVITG